MRWHPLFLDTLDRWRRALIREAARWSRDDAEDIAEDVIENLFRRWRKNPSAGLCRFLDAVRETAQADRLHAWCRRYVAREAKRYKRRCTSLPRDDIPSRDDQTGDLDTRDAIKRVLQDATPDERLLAERLERGMSVPEAAQDLRRSRRTVYWWQERLKARAIQLGVLGGRKCN